jgi:hypothetical protein
MLFNKAAGFRRLAWNNGMLEYWKNGYKKEKI